MKNEFEEIYKNNKWKAGNGFGSGEGSLYENALPYIDFLQRFINEKAINSVIDIGCGDWQLSRHINWDGLKYVGLDVVESVIDSNKQKYSSSSIKFECADIRDLEYGPVDLIIIKDVLQHLSIESISLLLERLPEFRYVLITNCSYDAHDLNADIPDGNFRPLDISKYPFNLKAGLFLSFHTDHSKFPPNYLHKKVYLIEGSLKRNDVRHYVDAIANKLKKYWYSFARSSRRHLSRHLLWRFKK